MSFTVLVTDYAWPSLDIERRILSAAGATLVVAESGDTAQTRGLIGVQAFKRMKPTAYLINTSRGAVIDEAALSQALAEGWIAGAALDVLSREPPDPSDPLLTLDNVIVTPHVAFNSRTAIEELEQKAAEHVVQVLRGDPPTNVVNPAVMQQTNCRIHSFH